MNDYINRLYEQLQWCSQDDFSISSFFPYNQEILYDDEVMYNQISIEFLYRCLKCDLITFLNGSVFSSDQSISLEDYASFLADSPIGIDEWKSIGSPLQRNVWTCEFFDGTSKLDKICGECGLIGFEEFNNNDPRWKIFINKINSVFIANNLPLDLSHPLFPVTGKNRKVEGVDLKNPHTRL